MKISFWNTCKYASHNNSTNKEENYLVCAFFAKRCQIKNRIQFGYGFLFDIYLLVYPKKGYLKSTGEIKVSFINLTDVQRNKFCAEPALSFVPEALAPPNGC